MRPVIVEAETLPDALTEPAAALARMSSESTVISPPKSETASAPTLACALDDVAGLRDDAARRPSRSSRSSRPPGTRSPGCTCVGRSAAPSTAYETSSGQAGLDDSGDHGGRRAPRAAAAQPRRWRRRGRRAPARRGGGRVPRRFRVARAAAAARATRAAPRPRRAGRRTGGAERARAARSRSGLRPRRRRSTRARGPAPAAAADCRSAPAASVPTAAVGTIASSDVAAASTWPSPSATRVGTKRMPPPTPNRPDSTPAAEAEHDREDDVPVLIRRSARRRCAASSTANASVRARPETRCWTPSRSSRRPPPGCRRAAA